MDKPRAITNRIFAIIIGLSCLIPFRMLIKIGKEAIQLNYVSDEIITNTIGALVFWLISLLLILIFYCCINMYLDTYKKEK